MREKFDFEINRGELTFPAVSKAWTADSENQNCFHEVSPDMFILGAGNPINVVIETSNVVQCYREIAMALISHRFEDISNFDGPFLVAVIDIKNSKLYVARDKFGLRSACYKFDSTNIRISEDLDSLASIRTLREGALTEWMHYGSPLSPYTFFTEVCTLAAGSYLSIDLKGWKIEQNKYFLPESRVSKSKYLNNKRLSIFDAKEEFSSIFDQSLRRAIGGNERVSLLLSGGVDSSLLAAYARRHSSVDAVTVDIYGENTETEVHFAKAVADKLDVKLRVVRFGKFEFLNNICKTIAETCSPIIIENAVALNYVASSGYLPGNQLIIDGEGADALMGGSTSLFKYSYSLLHLGHALGVNSSISRPIIERVRRYLLKFGLHTSSTLDRPGLDVGLGARNIEVQALTDRLLHAFNHVDSREEREISALMTREFYDYLVPLMVRIDKMSAHANSNTVLPYLLQPVFDFLLNLNSRHRFGARGFARKPTTKLLLKSVLAGDLGADLVYRPKVGFGIPAHRWMHLPKQWNSDLWVADHFKISNQLMINWIENCLTRDKMFVISMEIWARMFLRNIPAAQVHDEWINGQK